MEIRTHARIITEEEESSDDEDFGSSKNKGKGKGGKSKSKKKAKRVRIFVCRCVSVCCLLVVFKRARPAHLWPFSFLLFIIHLRLPASRRHTPHIQCIDTHTHVSPLPPTHPTQFRPNPIHNPKHITTRHTLGGGRGRCRGRRCPYPCHPRLGPRRRRLVPQAHRHDGGGMCCV